MKSKIKVIIADVSKLYMDALTLAIENENISVINKAESEEELLKQLRQTEKPDIVIYDFYLGNGSFESSIEKIKQVTQDSKLLVLIYDDSERLIEWLVSTGVNGVCDKIISDIDLLQETIKKIDQGETVILTRNKV